MTSNKELFNRLERLRNMLYSCKSSSSDDLFQYNKNMSSKVPKNKNKNDSSSFDDFILNLKHKFNASINNYNLSDSSSDDLFQSIKNVSSEITKKKNNNDSRSVDDFILNTKREMNEIKNALVNIVSLSDSSSDDLFQSSKNLPFEVSNSKKFEPKNQSSEKKEESIQEDTKASQLELEKEPESSFVKDEKELNPYDNFFVGDEEEKYHKQICKIGEGTKTVAYKIQDIRTKQIMCKKILKYNVNLDINDVRNFLKESEILHEINHPCICNVFSVNTAEDIKANDDKTVTTIAMFLEYLEYNLKDFLMNKKLDNTTKTKIVVEIAHGMAYLHKLGIIHRDLKIDNIILNSKLNAKIVDFVLASISEYLFKQYSIEQYLFKQYSIEQEYMSPEMMNEEDYDCKTDVYSFGIFLYSLFMQMLPKKNDKNQIELPNQSTSISEFGINFIKSCVLFNPEDRPTFENILNEIREHSYQLAPDVDEKIVANRDNELKKF